MTESARTPAPADASTVTSLRHRNRGTVLRHILLTGETTRAEIAEANNLSAASAANMVAELVDDGLVEEHGTRSSQGGRPISVVGPRADAAVTVGIDVGERGVAAELFDLSMTRIDREFRGGQDQETPRAIARDIGDALTALQHRHPDRWDTLLGVGLGLPGIVETHPDNTQAVYAQSLGWQPVNVSDLCRTTGPTPVFAENGAKLQARAELWFGNARNTRHSLVAMLGRGVGLGIITGGDVATGAHSSAAEWGHTTLQLDGAPCRCGNTGCVEAYLGADAILRRWAATGANVPGTGWTALGALVDASENGDTDAQALTTQLINELGAAIGSMVNLTNPERILLGGWVGERLIDTYFDDINDAIRRHTLQQPGKQYELRRTRFGGDAVAMGAAILPLEALITRGWATAPV